MAVCPNPIDLEVAILAVIPRICNCRVIFEFLFPALYLLENVLSAFDINRFHPVIGVDGILHLDMRIRSLAALSAAEPSGWVCLQKRLL